MGDLFHASVEQITACCPAAPQSVCQMTSAIMQELSNCALIKPACLVRASVPHNPLSNSKLVQGVSWEWSSACKVRKYHNSLRIPNTSILPQFCSDIYIYIYFVNYEHIKALCCKASALQNLLPFLSNTIWDAHNIKRDINS